MGQKCEIDCGKVQCANWNDSRSSSGDIDSSGAAKDPHRFGGGLIVLVKLPG